MALLPPLPKLPVPPIPKIFLVDKDKDTDNSSQNVVSNHEVRERLDEVKKNIEDTRNFIEQSRIDLANHDIESASENLQRAHEVINCSLCKKKILAEEAKLLATPLVCELGKHFCEDEIKVRIDKVDYLLNEYLPKVEDVKIDDIRKILEKETPLTT